MFGAVLWSDRSKNRALIWCEDHGNLAYFDGRDACAQSCSDFEEGDLVTFKVHDGNGMRVASDVQVVSSEEYPFLAHGLRDAAPPDDLPVPETARNPDRKIVPFTPGVKAPEPEPARPVPASRKTIAI